MNMEERIARINELYHKSQAQGLTAEEKEEQARLRREYVDSIKKNLKSQLDNIVIERPDGSTVDLGQKYGGKSGRQEAGNGEKAEPGRESAETETSEKTKPGRENAESENDRPAESCEKAPGTGGQHG